MRVVGQAVVFFLSCFGCSSACPEPEVVVAGFEDVAMMGQAIEERGGHLGIAEHFGPSSIVVVILNLLRSTTPGCSALRGQGLN